nr:MAG TPA: Plasmid maintenance system antidote protein [Caudoviricetes sp.]
MASCVKRGEQAVVQERSNVGLAAPTIWPGRTVAVGPEVLQEELDARGWTAADLARRGGCHAYWIERVLAGAAPSWHDALVIGRATGTSAECWMRLWRGPRGYPARRNLPGRQGFWQMVSGWAKPRR